MTTHSNMKSSSLATALESRHSGRTLPTTAFNLVKNVSITIPVQTESRFKHMVFTVPKSYLRSSAIGWDQFREDTRGLGMLKAFAFFVQMIYLLQSNDHADAEGQNIAIFFEWVRHKTNVDKHVAIRLHVFSNRTVAKSAPGPANIVLNMIAANKKIIEANKRRKKVHQDDEYVFQYESYQQVSSLCEYARQICDVYSKNYEASVAMDDATFGTTGGDVLHKADPEYVFRLESQSFCTDDACAAQNDINNYKVDDTYMFPDETRIYRLMPSDMNIDKFFRRYLPDYFFTRVKHPDVRFGNPYNMPTADGEDTVQMARVYVTPHLDRDRYIQQLDMWGERVPNIVDTWSFKWDMKDEITTLMKEHFNVWTANEFASTATTGNTLEFLSVTSVMHDMTFHDDTMKADGIQTISPLMKTELVNKHSLSDLDVLRIQMDYLSQWVTNRRELQEKMVEKFVERVWDDDYADVSEPGRMILMWKTHLRQPRVFEFRKSDPKLSVFANRCIRVMDMFDKVLFVSSAHKALFLLNHTKYNAYDQRTTLHFNTIFTGEGATSKSFLFDTVGEMSITGTTETITYNTLRADAIDGDQLDTIQQYHEAPPGMIIKNKHVSGEQEAMFKNKMTEQTIKVREFWRDENTGERKNRIAKSQCIGIVMANTNDDPNDISEAMATRFFKGEFEKTENGRPVQECQRGVRNAAKCPAAVDLKEFWLYYFREEQMRMWVVYKFMYMGILPRPNMTAADIVYSRVAAFLKRKYKINVPPRTKERFEILCTVFTIINALEHTFNISGSKHGVTNVRPRNQSTSKRKRQQTGKEFHPIQLLDIEPWLVCTEEIAVFSLTHISEEISNPSEFKVIQALWKIHTETKEYKEILVDNHGEKVTETDYSYVRLKSEKMLLTQIVNAIPATAGKMSRHNVKSVLKQFEETCSDAPKYKDMNVGRPSDADYLYPDPDEKFEVTKAIMLTIDQGHTHIHMEIFREIRHLLKTNQPIEDKMKLSIRTLFHKYRMKDETYLMGSPIRVNGVIQHPNVFDTVDMKIDESKTLSMVNPIHLNDYQRRIQDVTVDEIDARQQHRLETIKMDLTCRAGLKHAREIKMDALEYADNFIEARQEYGTVCNPIDYPTDVIKNATPVGTSDTFCEEYDFDISYLRAPPEKRQKP